MTVYIFFDTNRFACYSTGSLTPYISGLLHISLFSPVDIFFVQFAPWEAVLFLLSFKYTPTDVSTRAPAQVSRRFGFVARAYLIREILSGSPMTPPNVLFNLDVYSIPNFYL